MATSSAATVTHSWDSTGRTSRNQPTAPATANTPPRMLNEAAVTIPAKTRVSPNASTMGHAVGAGTSILFGVSIAPPLDSDHIHNREHDDPDCIHEAPVHGQNFEPLRVLAPQ